jgi:hypothetical protein
MGKFKYEIWTIGWRDNEKKDPPYVWKTCHSLKECGLHLGLTASQVSERITWRFDPLFKSYHVINEWTYQIKRLPNA